MTTPKTNSERIKVRAPLSVSALLTIVSLLGGGLGIAGGLVGSTWRMDDRIDAKVDRALKPVLEMLREVRTDQRAIRQLLDRILLERQGGNGP